MDADLARTASAFVIGSILRAKAAIDAMTTTDWLALEVVVLGCALGGAFDRIRALQRKVNRHSEELDLLTGKERGDPMQCDSINLKGHHLPGYGIDRQDK